MHICLHIYILIFYTQYYYLLLLPIITHGPGPGPGPSPPHVRGRTERPLGRPSYVYNGIPDRLYIPIDYIHNVARCMQDMQGPNPMAAPAAAAANCASSASGSSEQPEAKNIYRHLDRVAESGLFRLGP